MFSSAACTPLDVGETTASVISEQEVSRETEKERVIAEAQAYLEENYPDDEFTYVSGRSPDWAYRYYELSFTSKIYDDQKVTVFGDPRKDEDPNSIVTSYYKDDLGQVIYDYFDNYYQYPAKEELEKYCLDIAQKYISKDMSVDSVIGKGFGYAHIFDKTESFISNLINDTLRFSVSYTVDCSSTDMENSIQSNILEELADNKIYATDVVFIYSDKLPDGYHVTDHYTIRYGEIKEK